MQQVQDRLSEFTHLLSAPGKRAMYIDSNNANAGFAPLAEAVDSGRPLCISVRDDVLAIDSDKPSDPGVDQLRAEAQAEGVCCWTVASGGPGRQHLWLVGVTPEQHKRLHHRAKQLGLDPRARSSRIRPPHAPSRRDLAVRAEVVGDVAGFLGALRALGPAPQPAASASPVGPTSVVAVGPRRPLSATTWAMACAVDVPARFGGGRHRVDASIALSCVNAGWSATDFVRLRMDPRTGSPKALGMAPDRAVAYLLDKYQSAVVRATSSPAFRGLEDVLAELDLIEAQVRSYPFAARTAGRDRLTMAAFLGVARRVGRLEVGYDCRSLGDQIGVAAATANRSIHALISVGFLAVAEQDRRWLDATVYKLNSVNLRHSEPVGGAQDECLNLTAAHPAFHRGACGITGYETLLTYNTGTPRTVAEAARLNPRAPSTHRRRTRELLALGALVEDAGGGLRRASDFDWDDVAKLYGTDQRAADRRQRHKLDRISHREGRDEWERLQQLAVLRAEDHHVDPETGELRTFQPVAEQSLGWAPNALRGEWLYRGREAPEKDAVEALADLGDELVHQRPEVAA